MSRAECQQECDSEANPECIGYTHSDTGTYNGNNCFLRGGDFIPYQCYTKGTDSYWSTYVKRRYTGDFDFHDGVNCYSGRGFSPLSNNDYFDPDAIECERFCASDARCVGFTASSSRCYIRTGFFEGTTGNSKT